MDMMIGAIAATKDRLDCVISMEMGAFGFGSSVGDLIPLHWDDTIMHAAASNAGDYSWLLPVALP